MRCVDLLLAMLVLMILVLMSCKKDSSAEPNPVQPGNGIVFNPNLTYGTMTDQEGNEYKTITIGTQTWMAENLKVTKYSNGDQIPIIDGNTQWVNLTTDAYCWYNNNPADKAIYGAIYNWYAASDNRNIAPDGWHVPSDAEWITLVSYLGGTEISGGKLKEAGIIHWENPNFSATNSSGFTALGVGERDGFNGTFIYRSVGCRFWSKTQEDASIGYCHMVFNYANYCNRNNIPKQFGVSIRCVKD